MKVLRAIGVEDNVRKVAGRSQWQVMQNWKTARVISGRPGRRPAASFGITGATVHRADLLDVLATALPPGLVTLGKRCTTVQPDGDVAVARFADGTEIEAPTSSSGADGIHSAVRASLFGRTRPRLHREDLLPQRRCRPEPPRRATRHRRAHGWAHTARWCLRLRRGED